ncbi:MULTISPECIES: ABC transporter ATP-binding protein [Caproicibacterium]|jgi:ABC-type nitrate/sulfonate/bicarbonate transport system ATPase subunit|uniref:ATP-binding cassette domain-containing protein n=1 Tax=Caproicibacterium lactatifermentans TaxID=2666138 RepID=A0A859DRC8_9FIRM|nr:ABC transporter ATP-binding protein [Caproicibacterium lactatifermentans]ARP49814.1 nitrate ABC transporter ATP-binding protein [Ruminococcaceae bacterium CPB6]MDD4807066.1 ABC transporter ATP-binding protein [Oscillospiraceae bacterium]QKN24458.1 ATP-binding cassette domain-containing protein [Caproicibacterium lactatifermentans]QKO30529.1 ATP-binding cassette domain-containing protein [Caproicibacterium lactatifermentans]
METKLTAKGISKSYDGTKILEDVSIELRDQEIVSLLGVSGAGKTTLFNIISGLMLPDCGHVFLKGKEITGYAGHVSYMLQKDLLLPYHTVVDNTALPLILHGMPKKEARQKAGAYFAEFGLEGTQKKWPAQLSGGMRQRAALLRTYLGSEGVALLDEPFSALDTITKDAMHTWYLNVMQKIELSTLFITHDIDEAILLSDRVYILSGRPGHIIAEMPITVPRPRTREFLLSNTFLDYKRKIIDYLKI